MKGITCTLCAQVDDRSVLDPGFQGQVSRKGKSEWTLEIDQNMEVSQAKIRSDGFWGQWRSIVLLALLVFLLFPYVHILTVIWQGSGSRASASLVAFAGFLILGFQALRRTELGRPHHQAIALTILGLSLLLYLASVSFDVILGMGLSSWLLLVALLYLHGGIGLLKDCKYALALYLLAIPMPGFAMDALTRGLLIAATSIVVEILSWFLTGVSAQGFQVDFETGSVAIVSSCSGLSGLLLFLPLAVIIASLFRPVRPWVLIASIVLGLGLAFASNLFRILATAVLVHWDSSLANSAPFHETLGAVPLFLSIGVLIYFYYRVSGLPRSPREPANAAESSVTSRVPHVGALAILGIGSLLLLAAHTRDASRSFDFSSYEAGVKSSFDGVALERVRFQAENLLPDGYLCLEQADEEKPFFSVYIGYFPREGLIEKSQHDPRICYATLGWEQIGDVSSRTLRATSGEIVEIQRLLFRTGGEDRVVWFWIQRGSALGVTSGGDPSSWDQLWNRRTDSAWVRLELDVEMEGPDWEEGWANRILQLKLTVAKAMN